MENTHCIWAILLIIFINIFQNCSMEMISNDSCDVDLVADVNSLIEWYKQIFEDIKSNRNTNSQLDELNGKLHNLEVKMEKTLKQLEQKIEQIQQNPHGDIVIQRRIDGSEDFYRSWSDYRQGFGNSSGEFFIGLEKLYKLTNSRPYELRILMEDFENNPRYAKYDQFVVGNEMEKYALKHLGEYSGTAGDSLRSHLGQKFSTRDQDNDANPGGNCAVMYTGAWWYNICHESNLNGRYLGGATKIFAQGIVWKTFYYYSLKFVEMSIRPK